MWNASPFSVSFNLTRNFWASNLVPTLAGARARPSLISEYLFFKFEFDTYEQLVKFALSLHDKPFPFHLGKVLGENTLTTHLYLPKWEFRKFIGSLSKLIKQGLLKSYRYVIQDMFQTWRETIPYQHFVDGKWNYDEALYLENLQSVLDKWGLG